MITGFSLIFTVIIIRFSKPPSKKYRNEIIPEENNKFAFQEWVTDQFSSSKSLQGKEVKESDSHRWDKKNTSSGSIKRKEYATTLILSDSEVDNHTIERRSLSPAPNKKRCNRKRSRRSKIFCRRLKSAEAADYSILEKETTPDHSLFKVTS